MLNEMNKLQHGCDTLLGSLMISICMFYYTFQSPSVEPELALYVRVCESCLERLKNRQLEMLEKEEKMLAKGGDSLEMLLKVHSTMYRNEVKMEDQLNEVVHQILHYFVFSQQEDLEMFSNYFFFDRIASSLRCFPDQIMHCSSFKAI